MKGHWIPPSPKGFIDRIAAKLGYSKTIPTGLGSDVVEAVGTLNDRIVKLGSGETYSFTGTTAPANIPANTFFYQNGVLSFTPSLISQGSTIPSGLAVTNGGLNKVLEQFDSHAYVTNFGITCMRAGKIKMLSGAPRISGNNEWIILGTIPDEYKTSSGTVFFSVGTYNKTVYAGLVTASGVVQVYTPDALDAQVFINCTYV